MVSVIKVSVRIAAIFFVPLSRLVVGITDAIGKPVTLAISRVKV
jgi:hypothetical protein